MRLIVEDMTEDLEVDHMDDSNDVSIKNADPSNDEGFTVVGGNKNRKILDRNTISKNGNTNNRAALLF